MPINMMLNKEYKIDYKKMQSELMSMHIFHNKIIQQIYVEKWVNELKEADNVSTNTWLNPEYKALLLKEKEEAPECFQTTIKMANNEMYIHFRVSRILQILEKNKYKEDDVSDISIKEFTDKNVINWTKTHNTVKRDDPIIIVPFTIGKTYKELVIDGNHRITTAIKDNKKSIKAIILEPTGLVKSRMFSSDFDSLLYVFQNEVVWMGSHYPKKVSDESTLITQSYFSSGKVNVAV